MRSRRIVLIALIALILIALVGSGLPVRGQGTTATPTDTPTSTPTLTATPNLYFYATLQPGQDSAVIYTITAGQVAIFSILVFICVTLGVGIFAALREDD